MSRTNIHIEKAKSKRLENGWEYRYFNDVFPRFGLHCERWNREHSFDHVRKCAKKARDERRKLLEEEGIVIKVRYPSRKEIR
jgi:hypothetical protein